MRASFIDVFRYFPPYSFACGFAQTIEASAMFLTLSLYE
jgi:hypothetical protein